MRLAEIPVAKKAGQKPHRLHDDLRQAVHDAGSDGRKPWDIGPRFVLQVNGVNMEFWSNVSMNAVAALFSTAGVAITRSCR